MVCVEFIAHRINNTNDLDRLDSAFGVEVDLRDSSDDLYIAHDPFSQGDKFEKYVNNYNHGTMILNIKSERIEHRILELIRNRTFNYFFLDSSFPMIKLLSDSGEKNIALRFSEFEGLDTITKMAGKVDWVWVDCFTKFPLTRDIYDKLRKLNYKICIVSPELQGQDEKLEIYANYMKENDMLPDAICSKVHNYERWSKFVDFKK